MLKKKTPNFSYYGYKKFLNNICSCVTLYFYRTVLIKEMIINN